MKILTKYHWNMQVTRLCRNANFHIKIIYKSYVNLAKYVIMYSVANIREKLGGITVDRGKESC